MLCNRKYWYFVSLFAAISVVLILGFAADGFVDVFTQSQTLRSRTCVIIDAGHGGVDGGAISCTGAVESQINLEIALRLNDLLHLLGIKTKMIRTTDISIYTSGDTIAAKKVSDLKERVRIVNGTESAILVSIHQNYFSDSKYRGAQVFYRDNDLDLAKQLQNSFSKTINMTGNRNAKRGDGIYLLKHTRCTAALIECGFLSNPQEEKLLRSPEYQKNLCCIIGTTLSCYIQNLTAT